MCLVCAWHVHGMCLVCAWHMHEHVHGMCIAYEAIGLSHNLQRLSKLMFLMLLFSHWDGCLLFLLAYLEGFPDNSWVVRAGALHERDSLLDMTGFEQV